MLLSSVKMNKIEVKVINPAAVEESERMMVAMARLTQRGHKISCMDDFDKLMETEYTKELVATLTNLPHPTIQKFGIVCIAIIGASRRFLGQITRHQNEVKFMSGSLQYSDYTGAAQFCVPYELIELDKSWRGSYLKSVSESDKGPINIYLNSCAASLETYEKLTRMVGRDAAGYAMPQGLRNVLVIGATPYQWKHMISQRICKRNTLETMYIMLRCWEELSKYSTILDEAGPSCMQYGCNEGKMSCGEQLATPEILTIKQAWECSWPTAMLSAYFPLIVAQSSDNSGCFAGC